MAANNYKNSEFAGQSQGKVIFHCTTLFCSGESLLAAVHQLCSNFTWALYSGISMQHTSF